MNQISLSLIPEDDQLATYLGSFYMSFKLFWICPHSTVNSSEVSKNVHGMCHIKQELLPDVNLHINFFLCNSFCIYTTFKYSTQFYLLVINLIFTGKKCHIPISVKSEITPVLKICLHWHSLGDFH